jgi:starvation-inducible DNA-binding protein
MITTTKSIHSVAETIRTMMREQTAVNMQEETSIQLVNQMRKILADAYVLYFKAHTFHWNVEGSNFPQYHEFFGKIYTEVQGKLDSIAEEIRSLGAYAPTSLRELLAIASLSESTGIQSPPQMLSALAVDNDKVIVGLNEGYRLAEAAKEVGLSNFLQDLIDKHKKLAWMITSTLKGI